MEAALETLKKQKTVSFPEVGRLRLNIEGKVQFLPEDKNLLPEAFGLPQVRFHPIRTVADVAAQSLQAPVNGQSGGGSQRSARILWASLAAVIVVGFAVYVALSPEIKALFVMPQTKSGQEVRGNLTPTEVGQTVEKPGEGATPVPFAEEENPLEPGVCLIAIGLFKDQENVRHLKARIQASGFEPFTEQVRGFTRVGVRLSFRQESEIEPALAAIRKSLSPDAFILKRVGSGTSGK